MTQFSLDITMSLDGFVAGPNATRDEPLGEGGEDLYEWIVGAASWRERHGEAGGEKNVDDDVFREYFDNVGAFIMGRRMFSGGAGPWEDDPVADGWWGDDPPFRAPVFILTNHPRETVQKQGGTSYTFVTDGIESALEQAHAAAGGKNVSLAGGADVVQQYVRAGLLDEIQIHIAPIMLGKGVPLFDDARAQLEVTRVIDSPKATHVKYRIVK